MFARRNVFAFQAYMMTCSFREYNKPGFLFLVKTPSTPFLTVSKVVFIMRVPFLIGFFFLVVVMSLFEVRKMRHGAIDLLSTIKNLSSWLLWQ